MPGSEMGLANSATDCYSQNATWDMGGVVCGHLGMRSNLSVPSQEIKILSFLYGDSQVAFLVSHTRLREER